MILTTGKGELMSFNVMSRQLEDLDQFEDEMEDPTMKHQFEQLMNEGQSIDSAENLNYELRCDFVFIDCNQNIILIRGESLLVYKPNGDCDIFIEKLPDSSELLPQLMTLIRSG